MPAQSGIANHCVLRYDSYRRMNRSHDLTLVRKSRPLAYLVMGVLSFLLLTLVYQAPIAQRLDIGAAGDEQSINGFYFIEQNGDTTYRWSGATATITFAGAGARPWQLHLRLSGLRPDGPAVVTVGINGQPAGQVELGGEMAEIELPISRQQLLPSGQAEISLSTTTFVVPPDTRELGVMVDWAELRPADWAVTVPAWALLFGSVLGVLACLAVFEQLSGSLRLALGMSAVMLSLLALGIINARPLVSTLWPWLTISLLLFLPLSGRMRRASWQEWLALTVVVLLLYRFTVRAIAFFHTGLPPGDFTIYFDAAANLRRGLPLYDFAAARGMPNGPVYKYPPLFAILLAPLTVFPARSVAAGWYLSNLALAAVVFVLLARQGLRAQRNDALLGTFLVSMAFLALQPLWESLIRGQMDVIILTAAVAAMALSFQGRGEWLAGASLAFAAMLKIYPGLLIVYLLWRQRWRAVAGFAVMSVGLVLLSGLVAGWDVLWRYATEILTVQTAAVPWPENQSIDGFLARFVIPAEATTWYTTIAFPRSTLLLLYAATIVVFAATVYFTWGRWGVEVSRRRFKLGFAATLLIAVILWPTSWIHYEALLLLPFSLLILDQCQASRRSWGMMALLVLTYLIIAIGNEYLVLTPALHQDSPLRLLQSYKLYGMLILWGLMLWSANRELPIEDSLRV